MIVVVIALLVIVLVLIAAVSGLYWRVQEAEDEHHAKCIAHIAHYVGDEFAATVLITAAHDYDSAEENGRMKMLARLKHTQGGPSMPAIWLEDRAEQFRFEKTGA